MSVDVYELHRGKLACSFSAKMPESITGIPLKGCLALTIVFTELLFLPSSTCGNPRSLQNDEDS